MKYALVFCAGLCFSVFSYAQNVRADSYNNGDTLGVSNKDTLKLNLVKENLSVIYKNQPVPVHNIATLDSFMKKIPALQHLEIVFETENAKPETSRSINAVLNKCDCHITRMSRSWME